MRNPNVGEEMRYWFEICIKSGENNVSDVRPASESSKKPVNKN